MCILDVGYHAHILIVVFRTVIFSAHSVLLFFLKTRSRCSYMLFAIYILYEIAVLFSLYFVLYTNGSTMALVNKIFSFAGEDLEVASITDDSGQIWLLANPFATILGYKYVADSIRQIVSSKNVRTCEEIRAHGPVSITIETGPSRGNPIQKHSKFINRAGLFELIDKRYFF